MSAKRHESDECPTAGAIATGAFPKQLRWPATQGACGRAGSPLHSRVQPRTRKV